MRKLLIAAVICAVAGMGSSAQALCVAARKANIRSGPGTQYPIVWEVYRYMPFSKVGASNAGDWYAVRDVDGDVNWVHKSLVRSRKRCAVVTQEEVNVRTGPGTRFARAKWGPAVRYDAFALLQKKGPWAKVRSEWGETGWIHTEYLLID